MKTNARSWCENDTFGEWQLAKVTKAALMIDQPGKYDGLEW